MWFGRGAYRRRLRLGVTIAGVALSTGAALGVLGTASASAAIVWDLCGAALIVIGVFGWGAMPENRSGLLLAASGTLAVASGTALADTHATIHLVGIAVAATFVAPLVQATLSYPRAELVTREARALVASVYVFAFALLPTLQLLVLTGSRLNPSRPLSSWGRSAASAIAAMLLAWLIALLARKWRSAAGRSRRIVRPVVSAAAFAACAGLAVAVAIPAQRGRAPDSIEVILLGAALTPLPLGFFLGFIRARIASPNLGQFLIGVAKRSGDESLRDLLRDALDDPTLEIGYWARTTRAFVDANGRLLPLRAIDSSSRVSTLVGGSGEPVAVLLHEPSILDDEGRVAAVAAVVRVALENERLHAEVRAQIELARQSRARIVEVADNERRRIERDIHDGAQQRLVALAMAISLAEERLVHDRHPAAQALLDRAGAQARAALADLRQLARGIHPPLLTEAGLAPALTSLAERTPVPTRVLAAPARRFSPSVEAAAYFVVAEALSNVAKHARASAASVTAENDGGEIVIVVTDDGRAGAELIAGGGLERVEDRVAALGGSFELRSEATGTRITARIPCA
jgi:signal transduction histidine kinase